MSDSPIIDYPSLYQQWVSKEFCNKLCFLFLFKAIAGLAVTYGLNLNMVQGWVIECLCNVENQIISVERMLQYTSIPSEPPLVIEENQPDRSWPSIGEVGFRDLDVILVVLQYFNPTFFSVMFEYSMNMVMWLWLWCRSVMLHKCPLC